VEHDHTGRTMVTWKASDVAYWLAADWAGRTCQMDKSHGDTWQGIANERPPCGDLPLANIGYSLSKYYGSRWG
jgi:hypothetical protein